MRFGARLCFILIFGVVGSAWAGDWRIHQSSMGGKQRKMKSLEAEIGELILQKRDTEDPDAIRSITASMAQKHAELEKVAQEYREELLHIRFKHPEQGDESDRRYPRYRLKVLKEMETDFGLDAKLDRLRDRMHRTFGLKKSEPSDDDELVSSPGLVPTPSADNGGDHQREPAQTERPVEADERIRLSK